jgi:hypothetical protein
MGNRAISRVLLAAILTLCLPVAARAQNALETAIKATYLYKFAAFVGWPPEAAAGAARPFAICVIGADPFGALLDRTVAGQRVAGRSVAVLRLATARNDSPCQIAFIDGSPAQSVGEALRVLHGAPVLTVTASGEAPGVVDFVLANGRVRFAIDDEAAAQNGLTISSKLLTLALSVKPRQRSGAVQ